jgi:hypothetical protein
MKSGLKVWWRRRESNCFGLRIISNWVHFRSLNPDRSAQIATSRYVIGTAQQAPTESGTMIFVSAIDMAAPRSRAPIEPPRGVPERRQPASEQRGLHEDGRRHRPRDAQRSCHSAEGRPHAVRGPRHSPCRLPIGGSSSSRRAYRIAKRHQKRKECEPPRRGRGYDAQLCDGNWSGRSLLAVVRFAIWNPRR